MSEYESRSFLPLLVHISTRPSSFQPVRFESVNGRRMNRTSSKVQRVANLYSPFSLMHFSSRAQHKVFLAEDRLVRDLQTLSLDLSSDESPSSEQTALDTCENPDDNTDQEQSTAVAKNHYGKTQFQLYQLFQNSMRDTHLQDEFIQELYNREWSLIDFPLRSNECVTFL